MFVAGVFSGVLNAALGREAVATVPEGEGALGSGANNTARYLGSAVGVTVVAVIAAAGPGPGRPGAPRRLEPRRPRHRGRVRRRRAGRPAAPRSPAPGTGAYRRTGRYARGSLPATDVSAGRWAPRGPRRGTSASDSSTSAGDDQRYRSAATGADRRPAPLPQPALDAGRQRRQRVVDDDVDRRDDDHGRHDVAPGRPDPLVVRQQLVVGDDLAERGVLEDDDELADQRRQHRGDRLRQLDRPQRLTAGEPDRQAGLGLALRAGCRHRSAAARRRPTRCRASGR